MCWDLLTVVFCFSMPLACNDFNAERNKGDNNNNNNSKMIFAFKSHQSGVAQTTEHIFSKMFLINFFRAKVNLLFSGPRSKLLSEGTLSVSNICSRKSGPGRPLNASNSSQNCPLWVVRNNRTRFNKPVSPCLSSYKEILSWVVVL